MQPEGSGSSGVAVFAEALGDHEERESLPLRPHAPAGSIFEYLIRSQGWDREQFILSNTIWCRPGPKNFLKGAPYEYEAIEHCQQYNDHLIGTRRPKVLLALGDVAMRTLTGYAGKKQGISMLRGFILHSQKYDLPVVATWHPSYLIGRQEEQAEKGTGGGGGKKHVGTVVRDITLALRLAVRGVPPPDQTEYITNPTVEDARTYLAEVLRHPEWILSVDIENPKTQKEDEDELSYESAPIIQIQFSHREKWGIAFPWAAGFIEIILQLLATPNDKVGHNFLQYDLPILREHGAVVNGHVWDTQWLWHSIQPDLPRGLQFMTSFYAPNMKPWKHTSANLAEYGCADVDAPLRCFPHLLKDLDIRGVRPSYEQKEALVPIVDFVKSVGLPVDRELQAAYAANVQAQMQALTDECQTLVPLELRGIHPKQGYRTLSAKLKGLVASYDATAPPLVELSTHSGHFMPLDENKWCLRLLFNPNSRDQLIRYIQYRRTMDIADRMSKGYDKAKAERTTLWKVPTKRSGKVSTGNLELTPLVKKTQDRVLLIAQKYRELDKGLDFASGKWIPAADGRVHPTFSFGTSTGQMTASGPNTQQLVKHNEQGEVVRKFIRAPEGYVFIEFDFIGFHALMVGLLSRDLTYMRMARYGVHDFVVAHMMRLPEAQSLARMPDAELKSALKEIKSRYKPERNKAKRAVHGVNFGEGAYKLHQVHSDLFANKAEAQGLINLVFKLFPRVAQWQDEVRWQAHNDPKKRLLSPHGYHRYFYDVWRYGGQQAGEQSEECIAYLPANLAHGHYRERLIDLWSMGLIQQYRACNLVHDAVLFLCREDLQDKCIAEVKPVLESPSRVIRDAELAPDGLYVGIDASIGRNWGEYHAQRNPDGMREPQLMEVTV